MNFKTLLRATSLSILAVSPATYASDYPNKPIEMVIPYAAGGATDVIARMAISKLPEELGQPVVAVNRPGAGTTLAASGVARAPADGYTLYTTTAAHTISASLYSKLSYDPIKDFTPIHLIARIPIVLVTSPNYKVQSLSEYISKAKNSKNGITVGSPGNGSPQHLAQAMFQNKTGANFVHVPYRGDAPLITDMLAGQVQSAFITLSAALPQIQSGKLHAIAIANPTRIDAIKDVPTMAEAGLKDFNAATWFGIFGPAGLKSDIQQKLHAASAKVASEATFVKRIEDMGGQIMDLSAQQFGDYVKSEAGQWAQAVKISGARVD
jgi:tripartite-type tricarboxylate transporter receptor subunit TctC